MRTYLLREDVGYWRYSRPVAELSLLVVLGLLVAFSLSNSS
jgi:hypothetical protein